MFVREGIISTNISLTASTARSIIAVCFLCIAVNTRQSERSYSSTYRIAKDISGFLSALNKIKKTLFLLFLPMKDGREVFSKLPRVIKHSVNPFFVRQTYKSSFHRLKIILFRWRRHSLRRSLRKPLAFSLATTIYLIILLSFQTHSGKEYLASLMQKRQKNLWSLLSCKL